MKPEQSLFLLKQQLQSYERIGVAFSGGVDSAVLLKSAAHILGENNVVAFLGVSDSLARREKEIALRIAQDIGVRLVEIETQEMSNPEYLANNNQRCYFCKEALFTAISKFDFSGFGVDVVAYGENADDSKKSDRPGQRAAVEFGVIKPLSSAGLLKQDVRELAHFFGLSVADKPATPCLASRIKPFTQVTKMALTQVEILEDFLLELGFTDVRARYLSDSLLIEVPGNELNKLFSFDVQQSVTSFGKEKGLPKIEFSNNPLRSGSFSAQHLESQHV